MKRTDIFWHPLRWGFSIHRTRYAWYISIYRLQINIRRSR